MGLLFKLDGGLVACETLQRTKEVTRSPVFFGLGWWLGNNLGWNDGCSSLLTFRFRALNHLRHNFTAANFPLGPVAHCFVQIFRARSPEYSTVLQLAGQGDDVEIYRRIHEQPIWYTRSPLLRRTYQRIQARPRTNHQKDLFPPFLPCMLRDTPGNNAHSTSCRHANVAWLANAKGTVSKQLRNTPNNLLCATSLMVARKGDKVIVREYLLERHCFSKLVYLPCLDQVLDHNSCFAIRIVA